MVFKNSKPKSSNNSNKSIFVDTRPDGTTQFICHTVGQVEQLNKRFTEKGNIPIVVVSLNKIMLVKARLNPNKLEPASPIIIFAGVKL